MEMGNLQLQDVFLWQHIISYLKPWNALQLRQASHFFYSAVTGFQSYWYRQFCWYLIVQRKRPAMFKSGCPRTHKEPPSLECLDVQQEIDLATRLGVRVAELSELINERLLSDMGFQCSNPIHYVYHLPGDRFAIPLDPNDYKPDEQVYCYRFLIHNFRQQRQRCARYNKAQVKEQLRLVHSELRAKERELEKIVDNYRKDIQRIKDRARFLRSIHEQLMRVDENRVFHGQRSRTYNPFP
jgi:hypothetical protein